MTTVKYGIRAQLLLERLQKPLQTERDPLKQMVGIELLLWSFVARLNDQIAAREVVHAVHKHVLQMLAQVNHPSEDSGTYKHFSHTSSGWEISNDPNAQRDLRWRAVHPEYGERFFAEHDEILPFTCRHMVEHSAIFNKLKGKK